VNKKLAEEFRNIENKKFLQRDQDPIYKMLATRGDLDLCTLVDRTTKMFSERG
jgi:hypothetical protein